MPNSASSALAHYLAIMSTPGHEATPSTHLDRGAACVQPEDLARLPRMIPALRSKAARATESVVLQRRIALLLQYLEELPADTDTPALREIAFVLHYFLKGFDLIPDDVPQIGLLDDALLIETAFRRNQHELSEHWIARGRPWPDNV